MKITAVRCLQLTGTLQHPSPFWEERLIRPLDLYERHRAAGPEYLEPLGEGRYRIESTFLEIETDEGVVGRAGPLPPSVAYSILSDFRALLLGEDPCATELLWDTMYRSAVHGRKGGQMQAISAIDCALWDLKGNWLGQPVYRLLGGPTRQVIPAYASMLGFSLQPERVRERAAACAAEGFRAQKWFFRRGPADGRAGMQENLTLVQTLRETLGEDYEIMLDCWMSWDPLYTLAMAEHLRPLRPRWLEEPVLPDKIASYAAIRSASPVPISGGEHEYTRWGVQQLIEARAVDILQPDTYWAGGISEMQKICALASTADLPVIPHGHSVTANVHLIAAQPPNVCPLAENLVKWSQINEFFLAEPLQRVRGSIPLPQSPGLGMRLDESKIESRREIVCE